MRYLKTLILLLVFYSFLRACYLEGILRVGTARLMQVIVGHVKYFAHYYKKNVNNSNFKEIPDLKSRTGCGMSSPEVRQ
jgi:hypothetical protein